jgi:hypothetical protein
VVTPIPPGTALPADFESWTAEWRSLGREPRDAPARPGEEGRRTEERRRALRSKIEEGLLALARDSRVQESLVRRFGEGPGRRPRTDVDAHGIDGEAADERVPGHPAARVTARGRAPNPGGSDADCVARTSLWVADGALHRLHTWLWPAAVDPRHVSDDVDDIEMTARFD